MKTISEVTCCVVDCGLFLPMARRLAIDCKRVLYWSPECRSFPSVHQAVIGDGFDGVERVREIWDHIDELDLVCFPDVQCPELQLHLESLNIAVWGARRAMSIELGREEFLEKLEELGLNVPDHTVCEGIGELATHLENKEDQYIKISRFRGDMETWHWRNWTMDHLKLQKLAMRFGPLAQTIRFIVCPSIDTDIEIGGDTYSVDGDWPNTMLNGLEFKDTTYFGAVTPKAEMPHQVLDILESFSPFLAKNRYRQQWSCEVRIKGDSAYFIDPTTRGGQPSTGSQHLLWSNFSDIVWHGANGHLIEPEPTAKFSIESMIVAKREEDCWEVVELDPELEGHALFYGCALVDGCYCFPPCEYGGGELGWLVATGNTPKETLDEAKRLADLLPDGLDAQLENLTGLLKELESAKEQDIPFTEQPVPEPAEVVSD